MRKYEIVVTDFGLRLGVSVGTAYCIEYRGLDRHIKLCNMLYLPGKDNFCYNYNVHLPKNVVRHFESLSLDCLPSNYRTDNKLYEDLESFGVRPFDDYLSLMWDYDDEQLQASTIKQKIFNLSSNKK